jgi:hypothetical protein
MDWTDLTHDRDQCRVLMNTEMELGIRKLLGNS